MLLLLFLRTEQVVLESKRFGKALKLLLGLLLLLSATTHALLAYAGGRELLLFRAALLDLAGGGALLNGRERGTLLVEAVAEALRVASPRQL